MLRVFRTDDHQVVLLDQGQDKALLMRPEGAGELARALTRNGLGARVVVGDVTVELDAEGVALISPAGYAIRFPLHVAATVAAALRAKGTQAEELAGANQIIRDNGLLAWMGLPFGLSNQPAIKRESRKEAEKYLNREKRPPGGIEPNGIVGTPAVTNHGRHGNHGRSRDGNEHVSRGEG